MSLTIEAPAAIAARATAGLYVSIEMSTSDSARIASISGTTAAISCAAATVGVAGLALSPPISRIRAPSATSWRASARRALRIGVAARVGERVAGGVDDPHQPRVAVGEAHAAAADQEGRASVAAGVAIASSTAERRFRCETSPRRGTN